MTDVNGSNKAVELTTFDGDGLHVNSNGVRRPSDADETSRMPDEGAPAADSEPATPTSPETGAASTPPVNSAPSSPAVTEDAVRSPDGVNISVSESPQTDVHEHGDADHVTPQSKLLPQQQKSKSKTQSSKSSTKKGSKWKCWNCQYYVYDPEDSDSEEGKKSHSQQDQDEIPSITKAAEDFRERSSLVGFTQVSQSHGTVKKVFWFIVMLVTLAALLTHLTFLIMRYVEFGTNVELDVTYPREIYFPAVTVCNNNMIVNPEDDPIIPSNPRSQDRFPDYFKDHYFDEKFNEGHKIEDFLVSASFENRELGFSDFKHTPNPRFGNCITFNYNGTEMTRRALPGYGLELVLNVESYKYYNGSKYTPPEFVGAVLKAHNHFTETIVEEGGKYLYPNTLSQLAVTQMDVETLGGRYGDCVNDKYEGTPEHYYYEGEYNRRNCENSCLQREIITRCCCYIKTMKRDLEMFDEKWNTCDGLSEEEQLSMDGLECKTCKTNLDGKAYEQLEDCNDANNTCWDSVWDRYDNGLLACDQCKDKCDKTHYEVSSEQTKWPSHDYVNSYLIPRLENDISAPEDYDITEEFIDQNLLKVHVFFESMSVTTWSEVPAVGDVEFISELGAVFALWAGLSIWTVFQSFEFLADAVVITIRKFQNRNKKEDNMRVEEEATPNAAS